LYGVGVLLKQFLTTLDTATPQPVDCVLARELAHLREAHHGPARQLLARVMSDYDECERELAQRGARLWFGGNP